MVAQLDFLGSVHVSPKFEYYCIGINFDMGKKFSPLYYNTIKMEINFVMILVLLTL